MVGSGQLPPGLPAVTEARRIDRGRSHSYRLNGAAVDSVTGIIDRAIPKPALTAWAAREVAAWVAYHPEKIAGLQPDEIIDLAKGVPFRERDRAANRGTDIHGMAQRLVRHEEVEVPDELAGHVESYVAFLDRWNPTEELAERPVFSQQWQYAGTFDLLCRLRGMGRTLLDIKTNRSGPFAETALQLAAYANADFMTLPDGSVVPLPTIDSFAVVWVRADGYDVIPYRVGEHEWKAFLHARQVAWWLDTCAPAARGDSLNEPPPEPEVLAS